MKNTIIKNTAKETAHGYHQSVTFVGKFEDMIALSAILKGVDKKGIAKNPGNK